jgi:hypothetical protein
MKLKLPRYRWFLLIACLAVAIAVISGWQLSSHRGRFTREQYDRIRLGMRPADVAEIMGPPSPAEKFEMGAEYELVDAEGIVDQATLELWEDRSVQIYVFYHDGKAVQKQMLSRVSPWKVKCRAWLDWLRGLLGWKGPEVDPAGLLAASC